MSKASNLAGFAASISSNNNLNVGIITASSFVGNLTGNSTGMSGAPNLNVGVVTASSFFGNGAGLTGVGIGTTGNVNTTGIITASSFVGNLTGTATGLSGTPNVVLGIATVSAGSTSAPSITPTGDSNTGIFFPSADTLALSSGGSERLRVDSSGNINIDSGTVYVDAVNNRLAVGTTSPDAPLEVVSAAVNGAVSDGIRLHMPGSFGGGASGNSLLFTALNGSFAKATYSSIAGLINTNTAGSHSGILTFSTASGGTNSERARIDNSGRLLVGTSSGRNIADGAQGGIQYETTSYGGISITNNRNDVSSATLAFGKQRSGSVGGNTIVQNGDGLGAILFGGADGTDLETPGASIGCSVDGTPGSNDMPGRLVFSTTADGAASSTERMRIDNAGRLGINITSQSTNPDRAFIFASASDKYALHLSMANSAASGAANVAALRIDGNQGRGTSPYYGAQIVVSEIDIGACYGLYSKVTGTYSNQYAVYGEISKDLNAYTSAFGFYSRLVASGVGGAAYFYWGEDNGTTRFYVTQNGGIANYQSNNTNLSDEREKKDIINLDSTWDCLKHWEIKKFRYNEDADTIPERYGVIAQQVQEHCPEVIDEWIKQAEEPAKLDEDGNEIEPAKEKITRMAVKEQQMYWMAIKALQEAQDRIEQLENSNADLLVRVSALENP